MKSRVCTPIRALLESGEGPEFVGGWLDLAIAELSSETPIWTVESLSDRWAPHWDVATVREWFGRAVELNVLEAAEEQGAWRLSPAFRVQEHEDGIAVALRSPRRSDGDTSSPPANRVKGREGSITFDLEKLPSKRQLEKAYVAHVIARCSKNKRRAARVLRIDASTLHRKLRRWEED